MSLGADFRIKFQQYDDYAMTTDGRGYDEIVITAPAVAEDWYRFSLDDGQTATVGVSATLPNNLTMELYDASSTLLATGTAADNLDQVIRNFADTTTDGLPDTYYVRITNGSISDYGLVVTRGTDFDTEANDSLATAQDISGAGSVLGSVDSGQDDYYAVSLNADDHVLVTTTTPFDDPAGQPINGLDPQLVVYDPSGAQITSDSNSAPDGHNAQLAFQATVSGFYRVRVSAEAGQGEYVLSVIVDNTDNTPPTAIVQDIANRTSAYTDPIAIAFSEAIDASTFTFDDLTLTLSGNPVNLDGSTVTITATGNPTVYEVTLDPTLTETAGTYVLTVEAGGITDLAGNQLTPSASDTWNQTRAVIDGTAGADKFIVTTGAVHKVTINGSDVREFDPALITEIHINGDGTDQVFLYDSVSSDVFQAGPSSATMDWGTGGQVTVFNMAKVYAYSRTGDSDIAELWTSDGDDKIYFRQDYQLVSGAGFYNYAKEFADPSINFTTTGGSDIAYVYDSDGTDKFVGKPGLATMDWGNDDSIEFSAANMAKVYAYSRTGDSDIAELWTSDGDDKIYFRQDCQLVSGAGFYNYAKEFADPSINFTTTGGSDIAYVYDSDGTDKFVGKPGLATMDWGNDDSIEFSAANMAKVYAYSRTGDSDIAELWTSDGDDKIYFRQDYQLVSGAGFYNYAKAKVYAYSRTGDSDIAELWTSDGDDKIYFRQDYQLVSGAGFYNYAKEFADPFADPSINFTTTGGSDIAYVYDSDGTDKFVGKPGLATMDWGNDDSIEFSAANMAKVYAYSRTGDSDIAELWTSDGADKIYFNQDYQLVTGQPVTGSAFYNYAKDFAVPSINFTTTGGDDIAYVYDSDGTDKFVATPTLATMDWGNNGSIEFSAPNMAKVYAYSRNGDSDIAELWTSDGADKIYFNQDYQLVTGQPVTGSAFYNYAKDFAIPSINFTTTGGDDIAYVYDSDGTDKFVATPTLTTMDWGNNGSIEFSAPNMAKVYAYSRNGDSDIAELWTSDGADKIYFNQDYQLVTGQPVTGSAFYNYAKDFAVPSINFTTTGGDDIAYVYDSDGTDKFVATPTLTTMDWGNNGSIEFSAPNMAKVYAYSRNGDSDIAELWTSDGADKIYFNQDYQLVTGQPVTGSAFYNYAKDFAVPSIDFTTTGGDDIAYVYDSDGTDKFVATPTLATMNWGNDENIEFSAPNMTKVYAYSQNGGDDIATLSGSTGNDRLTAAPTYSLLQGDNFYIYASGFAFVDADAQGGADNTAYFYDSADKNAFHASSALARIDYLYNESGGFDADVSAAGFQRVYANFAKDGDDVVELLDDLPGGDSYTGNGSTGQLTDNSSYWIYLSSLGSGDTVRLTGEDPVNKGTVDAASIDYLLQYDDYWEE